MDSELVVDLARDGVDFPRRSAAGDLVLVVSGTVTGLDLSGLAWRSIEFRGGPGWPGLVPRRFRPTALDRRLAGFEDCDFSGLRTKHFDPSTVRFERCRFEDVKINNARLRPHGDFVGCTFSGRIDANISAQGATVQGNDFSRVVGLGFHDGVDWRANRFDLGRSQMILQAGTAFYRACEAMEGQDHFLDGLVGSLARPRRGPIGYPGQDWELLQEAFVAPEVWQRLLAVYDGPFGPGQEPVGTRVGTDPIRRVADAGRHHVPDRVLPGADLSDADLMGAELAGADLRGVVLRGADLRGADLTGADLTGADLTDADAGDVTLAGARIAGAVLRARWRGKGNFLRYRHRAAGLAPAGAVIRGRRQRASLGLGDDIADHSCTTSAAARDRGDPIGGWLRSPCHARDPGSPLFPLRRGQVGHTAELRGGALR